MNEKTNIPRVIWFRCNECGQETKHSILHQVSRHRATYDEGYLEEFGTNWELLQCCGCEEVSLQRSDWYSEDIPPNATTTYFPPRVSRKKTKLDVAFEDSRRIH